MTRPSDLGRCRSCGARPRIKLDGEGCPTGVVWNHGDHCERTEAEERRLRSLAEQRGASPGGGLMWTPPMDGSDG